MCNLLLFFFIPFFAALFIFAIPFKHPKRVAVLLSLLPLLMLPCLFGQEIDFIWMKSLSIHFHLKVDTLSMVFLLLTNVIVPIALLSDRGSALFCGLVLLLQGLLNGFFTAQDLAFFTFFWEAMLLPLYFIISRWGSGERQRAAYTFIIYMIVGSVFMVAAVLGLYFAASTFDIEALTKVAELAPYAGLIAFIFLLAFAVKTPLFPFHGWLPLAYSEAPLSGTILLSAILSKAGIYGLLRISIPFFPTLMQAWMPYLLTLAIIGVIYGAMAAWAQTDYKKLLAYSSFSHVNFVLAGLFVWDSTAQAGAIFQAVNHAITISGLFLLAGWLEARIGTRNMGMAGGLAVYMPRLAWLTLFFILSSVALPGLNSFVGEVLILYGVFGYSATLAAILGLTVILSVVYMLRWMHSVYFEVASPFQAAWVDLNRKEAWLLVPLVLLVLWLGIYPMPALSHIEAVAASIIKIGKI